MQADDPDITEAEMNSRIANLEVQHTADRDTIDRLEGIGTVDRDMISQLEADGDIDRAKIANLEAALATCRRIGAAIGIIMAIHKVNEGAAFDVLRQASQLSNRKLRDVADDVMHTGSAG